MTTNRKNNLIATVDTTLKRTKVVFVILMFIMMLSLVGCGEEDTTSEQNANAITTEEERTTQEDIDDNPELPGGEQEIATEVVLSTEATTETTTEATTEVTTEATTEAAPSGKYSYTIYGGIQVSLDTNIDDYISVDDKGRDFFKLHDVATGLGWNCENGDSFSQYTYNYDDCVVYFAYWNNDEQIQDGSTFSNRYQIEYIDYDFLSDFTRGESFNPYYVSKNGNDAHKALSVHFSNHYDSLQYCVPGSAVMSRDDIILVTYMLESVKHNPGENPFCYINADDYQVRNTEDTMNYELP